MLERSVYASSAATPSLKDGVLTPFSASRIIGNIITNAKQLDEGLNTGVSPVQRVATLETFIQSTLVDLTQLASQLTNLLAVGEIAIVFGSTEESPNEM